MIAIGVIVYLLFGVFAGVWFVRNIPSWGHPSAAEDGFFFLMVTAMWLPFAIIFACGWCVWALFHAIGTGINKIGS